LAILFAGLLGVYRFAQPNVNPMLKSLKSM
jgi:hypothetical protein